MLGELQYVHILLKIIETKEKQNVEENEDEQYGLFELGCWKLYCERERKYILQGDAWVNIFTSLFYIYINMANE